MERFLQIIQSLRIAFNKYFRSTNHPSAIVTSPASLWNHFLGFKPVHALHFFLGVGKGDR